MDTQSRAQGTLQPGQRVRVEQTIHTRTGDWTTSVDGKIIAIVPKPTGSWFAHGKGDVLWLQRLRLEKADGELVEINLDSSSIVTILKNSPDA